MNPILPSTVFNPDPEPHVYEHNGERRVYIYGSKDDRVTGYCGPRHDVWSAPANDLTEWTNHGEAFHVKQVQDLGYGLVDQQHFGAPDAAYNPVTKKYYLYTFLGAPYQMDGRQGPALDSQGAVPGFENTGPKCVVAESDCPTGPFLNPKMCDWPPANERGTFDPSVLVDEQPDGSVRVYVYWGMVRGDRWAEVDPDDMHTIIDPKTGKPNRNAWHQTLPEPDQIEGSSFFEASSIKKVEKDHYVFIYSANERRSALTYCYSHSPEGPWKYGGRIVDNDLGWKGGTGHGSIAQVNGQWYVFYHRVTDNDYNRQVSIEPIRVIIDGDKVTIPPVEITSQGVETGGLDAFRRYHASIVSTCTNNAHIDGQGRSPDGLNPVIGIDQPHTVLGYKYLNFGGDKITDADAPTLKLNIKRLHDVQILVQVARPSEADAADKRVTVMAFGLQKYVPDDDGFHEISLPITALNANAPLDLIGGLKGRLAFFLSFDGAGGELCQLREFELAKGDASTPNPLREIRIDRAKTKSGTITADPTKSRGGESIKLSVVPDHNYILKSIKVLDKDGKSVELVRNGAAPYAPVSFHFKMPASAVEVSAQFVRDERP